MPWEGTGEKMTLPLAAEDTAHPQARCPLPVLTSSDTRLSIAPSMECSAPRQAGDILLGEPGDVPQADHTCAETEVEELLLSSSQKNRSENWAVSARITKEEQSQTQPDPPCHAPAWVAEEGGAPMLSPQPKATMT